jgi:cytochrome c oxidase subunit 2
MGDGRYTLHMIAHMWQFEMGSDETYADYFATQSDDPNFQYVSADATNQVVRVPVGSVVEFIVTSQDVTHGFIIERHNANIEVIPGHVGRQTVRFDEPGEFRLLCHEYCGQAHQSMHAMIVVEEE